MSYDLLRSLYFGELTNADVATATVRQRLHVKSPLDGLLPKLLAGGRDLVISGNPGDGKSHLIKSLQDRGVLEGVELELDLSAKPTRDIVERWREARGRGQPFILCANQGPLRVLINELQSQGELTAISDELSLQLGRLSVTERQELPQEPRHVYLVDLADRNLLDLEIIREAIRRMCHHSFLPPVSGKIVHETSAGRNITLLTEEFESQERLARLLMLGGLRAGKHLTFRHIWGAISYALTAAKMPQTLEQDFYAGRVDISSLPIGNLTRSDNRRGKGPLIEAVSRYADPASVQTPELDEELWAYGTPRTGRWLTPEDLSVGETPLRLWEAGRQSQALERFSALKRAVALAHDVGEELLCALEGDASSILPSKLGDQELVTHTFDGLKRLYLTSSQACMTPEWLRGGLPLWVNNTYLNDAVEARPHVAIDLIEREDLDLLRPQRAPWLAEALGPHEEVAWLRHTPSGELLRLDPDLLAQLGAARLSEGPQPIPEKVQRLLTRVAGWSEGRSTIALGGERFAVLERPRGSLIFSGTIQERKGIKSYER